MYSIYTYVYLWKAAVVVEIPAGYIVVSCESFSSDDVTLKYYIQAEMCVYGILRVYIYIYSKLCVYTCI